MNSFGRIFSISIYGESHGEGVGVLLDGVPPGISVSEEDFKEDLSRRKGGAAGTTSRVERDRPQLVSGLFKGRTTGAPLNIFFSNDDKRSGSYSDHTEIPRPGHADLTARQKYLGYNDHRGGGMFSGRMTVGLVAAGVIAKKILGGVRIEAAVTEAGGSTDIKNIVERAEAEGDSIGGWVECRIAGLHPGVGEPFFDSVESVISHLVFSIPGIRGIEFGSGFAAASMKGSEFNDQITGISGSTRTNHSGGINGGISNGNEIVFKVAVRPASSIKKEQESMNMVSGEMKKFRIEGRHDTCIALRAPVIVESVAAVAVADLLLVSNGLSFHKD